MSKVALKLSVALNELGLFTLPFNLKHWRWIRLALLVAVDIVLVLTCYWLAFAVRLESFSFNKFLPAFYRTSLLFVGCHIGVYLLGGMYRQVWRYATISSALLIARCVLLATCIATFFVNLDPLTAPLPPRSVPVIFWLMATMSTIFVRFSWRLLCTFQRIDDGSAKDRCLIYGAGSAGSLLAQHIGSNPDFPLTAVGFVDDDRNKVGRMLQGLKIFGLGKELPAIAAKQGVSTVIIALHAAPGKMVRQIVLKCQEHNIKPLILPDIATSLGSEVIQPRAVDVKDLLCRSPKNIDRDLIQEFFRAKSVMVTGAGGSVGSELCRQIVDLKPRKVILFDSSEYNLYKIRRELLDKGDMGVELVTILGSVTNARLVESVLSEHMPSTILHASAYKHVSLVEDNPLEGIINNVLGTKVVLELAAKMGVSELLLISTDKAVRPTSVMGATKRCCELLVQVMHQSGAGSCRVSAVRFGNVLGSSGSVVPRFIDQIQRGGPVTVTHPDVTRYFMLTMEAVGLVLQSIAMAKGGEIFVLNMGEPVRIAEMASLLINLAGKVPGRDIDIVYTGLESGEKLYEELILEGSEQNTLHDDVLITTSNQIDCAAISRKIGQLLDLAQKGEKAKSLGLLWELVAESGQHVNKKEESYRSPLAFSLPAAPASAAI